MSRHISVLAGQYLPAPSEDHEERRGQNEEPLQLPGRMAVLQTSPKFMVFSRLKKMIQLI